jgi:hypothetical protein
MSVPTCHVATCNAHAGRGRGADLNLLAAYQQYTEDVNQAKCDIYALYWVIAHSPSPENEGGCRFNDLTWGKRDREFDEITWGEAKKRARDAVGEFDSAHADERDDDVADMLGAAGTMPEGAFHDSGDEYQADVGGLYSEDE